MSSIHSSGGDSNNSTGESVNGAEKRVSEGPIGDSLENIHQRTEDHLRRAVQSEQSILLESPPSSGKTTNTFQIISETDAHFTYLTKREDLYDQAVDLCEECGIDHTVIPSPHRDCPSFDEHSSHHDPRAETLYGYGIPASRLHDLLDLTCSDDCRYVQFWQDFDHEEHDVLVGHYKHAYITSVVEDRIVVIDEFPGGAFEQEFEDADQMITRFLEATDELPFRHWDDLLDRREAHYDEGYEWFAQHEAETPASSIANADESIRWHSLTPFLVWAVLQADKRDNGFGVPAFNLDPSNTIATPFGELENRRRVAVDYWNEEIHVLTQPDLSNATGVVGLDGTPLRTQWELATGEEFDHWKTIDSMPEMNDYISDILGITVKQANEHLKPYHGGNVALDRDEAILYGVEVAEGQKPALITTAKALEKYREAGILDRTKQSMNYAQVLSSNAFEGESVGVIHGAPHPGDATLKRWAAYFGHHIDGEGQGMAKTYGAFGDRLYNHFVHNQILQAVLRFGRGESEATVYVNSAAMPDWLDIDGSVRVERFNTRNKRAIADHLRDAGEEGATKTDLTEATGISQTTIEDVLYEFRDRELIEEEQQPDWPYRKTFRWEA